MLTATIRVNNLDIAHLWVVRVCDLPDNHADYLCRVWKPGDAKVITKHIKDFDRDRGALALVREMLYGIEAMESTDGTETNTPEAR